MTKDLDSKYTKILHAAIEIISIKGLEKTSISEIVKQAGVAQGTFYLYFQSKNALIPAIADNLLTTTLDTIKKKVAGETSFWRLLEIFIDETFHITDAYKDVIVLCYSGLAIDHSMEKWEAIYQPYYDWFESILKKGIASNELTSRMHVNWTARMVINLVENAAERFYIGQEQNDTLEVYKTEVYTFLQRSLGS
ncbi:TetR family transcriptional regulator [Paenibacillus aceris]|uniref:AcrR family transcriptional regulator n=1 Tax=Paenibacillus aceris TaxID=869555 RepID=A0ABS4I1J7_9BACL|nr:TetR family transcriptional regulator [Paenibacillus aceris]MBP1964296.1 AcrR family transcriptional regulator [Paenibacillus aceris]NHW36616.1 TetR/AcrR family transcriptional regulator [Paenibacillus aceris]